MPEEWLATAEAAELLKVSRRHVTELARQGKLKAKREGKNWLIHSSLSTADEEVKKLPQGISEEAYRNLEEQVSLLKEQVQQKDKQIEVLQKHLDDASQRHDTIVLQLTRQLENQQRLLEYHQEPWYRKWFRKRRTTEGGS